MIALLSPAKTLDFTTPVSITTHTQPQFLNKSEQLIKKLRKLKPQHLQSLMSISPQLAELNMQRYLNWHLPFTPQNARQAILAFKGDVYLGLQAANFTEDNFLYAQQHVRILSGLYGMLRPLDLIQPYRLEMGTAFVVSASCKNLYQYWGKTITQALNNEILRNCQQYPDDGSLKSAKMVLNLASNEYFAAIVAKQLKAQVLTIQFKEYKNDQLKMISFFAKRARGLFVNYMVKNNINQIDDLQGFTTEGYCFNSQLSTPNNWLFTRINQV
ncbi:MAG: peroxide stress protein YaaA [Sphingobacteriales bacterium]|jgi:cytoplasmic iron level regulating protein YaaA (DUF328/UPF0246 family)|nr:peroxide stress protein YaaA [Sphingobacteriales bacterium]MBP9141952.1 peroxide stress protein YaaA [Chitinophagales bacterium]MDA0199123.1 peroxide stress protein YaaA [Bacteroidota bacterium]MBK6888528.1 peroxide stress protein YaaA [Sphingobacteriales bacterium]MBK8679039.1 peroxide stress protein YaaA [Sphingobacteriales bacterium]